MTAARSQRLALWKSSDAKAKISSRSRKNRRRAEHLVVAGHGSVAVAAGAASIASERLGGEEAGDAKFE